MTFSIRYSSKHNEGYTEYAVDWNWNIKGEWARSEKEGLGGQWNTIPGLDEEAYETIIKHFGLTDFKDNFPLENIINMSWEKLGIERRTREKKYALPYKEIKNDTFGDDQTVQ